MPTPFEDDRLGVSARDKQDAGGIGYGLTRHRASDGSEERPGLVPIPRYYFVLSGKDGFVEDVEGTELPDLATARREAAKDVAHLRQPRIGGRRSWAGWAMQVRDEGGAVLCEVPFTRLRCRYRADAGLTLSGVDREHRPDDTCLTRSPPTPDPACTHFVADSS